MKVFAIILVVLGGLLIALNLFSMSFTHPADIEERIELIAYYIGYNIFNIIGIIMIIGGIVIIRRRNRRLLKKKLMDSLPG